MGKTKLGTTQPWIVDYFIDGENGVEGWRCCVEDTDLISAIREAKNLIQKNHPGKKYFVWDAGLGTGFEHAGDHWEDGLSDAEDVEF